jgi:uncharacterized protein
MAVDREVTTMLGELTADQIEQLLRRETVGRIGCHAEGRVYVVPITFAYDGECVYAHSADGLKIRTMRANPTICFEVEQLDSIAHWQSVVAWGKYEELSGAAEERAAALLRARFNSMTTSATAAFHATRDVTATRRARTIVFRIRLEEKTGRYER